MANTQLVMPSVALTQLVLKLNPFVKALYVQGKNRNDSTNNIIMTYNYGSYVCNNNHD